MFAKAQPKPNSCQTYVVKAKAGQMQSNVFLAYAKGEIRRGAGAWALVEKAEMLYLVITFAEEGDFKCRARRIKELIQRFRTPSLK